jgi:hypothetical protein
MWQLASSAMHRQPEMVSLAILMANVVYEEIGNSIPGPLPEFDRLVPQVFPVKMAGNVEDPPVQLVHRDGADGRRPQRPQWPGVSAVSCVDAVRPPGHWRWPELHTMIWMDDAPLSVSHLRRTSRHGRRI